MLKENVKIAKNLRELKNSKKRISTWKKAIFTYARELVDGAEEKLTYENCEKVLLDGADNWHRYSWDGFTLEHDYDIAKRLCTPSQFKKHYGYWGIKEPNKKEDWKDIQAKALYEAFLLIQEELLFQKGTRLSQE